MSWTFRHRILIFFLFLNRDTVVCDFISFVSCKFVFCSHIFSLLVIHLFLSILDTQLSFSFVSIDLHCWMLTCAQNFHNRTANQAKSGLFFSIFAIHSSHLFVSINAKVTILGWVMNRCHGFHSLMQGCLILQRVFGIGTVVIRSIMIQVNHCSGNLAKLMPEYIHMWFMHAFILLTRPRSSKPLHV